MGFISTPELSLVFVFMFLLVGWVFPDALGGLSATGVALIGLSILLVLQVLTWDDLKSEHAAWDTLIWFAILVTFANYLNKYGFISYLAENAGELIANLDWKLAFVLIILSYTIIHYFFASSTAQVGALYGIFLTLGIAAGAPPILMALMLGFAGNLYSGLTHYSVGHAPIFYGANYVEIKKFWLIDYYVWL